MMTCLSKALPLAVLLAATSGCEMINFEQPVELPPPVVDTGDGAVTGPAPLYPFRPGSIWQYDVTNLDGSKGRKYVAIDKQTVMVGGNGPHQLDQAYPVRTSGAVSGQAWLVTMPQKVGNKIVKRQQETLGQKG